MSLPSGAQGVSSGGYDPFIKFPWAKDLANGWPVGGMQSLFFNTEGTGRNDVWERTFYVEKQITKTFDRNTREAMRSGAGRTFGALRSSVEVIGGSCLPIPPAVYPVMRNRFAEA